MCGRFVLVTPGKSLAEHFRLAEEPSLEPRYNIAPTQPVAIIKAKVGSSHRELKTVRWGLIPFWAKDAKMGARFINARSETASDKPAFRAAFRMRRCLIPADGFYEWKKLEKGSAPYLVVLANRAPFAFAGLWESWKSPGGELIESCTILTTDANELIQPIHDRMPAILSPGHYELWIDPDTKTAESLKQVLKPFPSEAMIMFPVSGKVNKASYDDADCVEPLTGRIGSTDANS
jgi:putative SOS response-associated peptidase YedK